MKYVAAIKKQQAKGEMYCGVDIESEVPLNAKEAKLLDIYYAKAWAIRFALDVSSTVLKIDQIVISKPAGGPKPPKQGGHWDDQD